MNTSAPAGASAPDEIYARLFSNMVMQYASMALMFMGQAPHPETGEKVKDLEAAQMFISQLEMLQVKTKGNLTPQEESLLKQSLMTTRLAFVESIEDKAAETAGEKPADKIPEAPSSSAEEAKAAPDDAAATTAAAETDERKKFVKKY